MPVHIPSARDALTAADGESTNAANYMVLAVRALIGLFASTVTSLGTASAATVGTAAGQLPPLTALKLPATVMPQATELSEGAFELASAADMIARTPNRAVTASVLAGTPASTTQRGCVPIANEAEYDDREDVNKLVTPALVDRDRLDVATYDPPHEFHSRNDAGTRVIMGECVDPPEAIANYQSVTIYVQWPERGNVVGSYTIPVSQLGESAVGVLSAYAFGSVPAGTAPSSEANAGRDFSHAAGQQADTLRDFASELDAESLTSPSGLDDDFDPDLYASAYALGYDAVQRGFFSIDVGGTAIHGLADVPAIEEFYGVDISSSDFVSSTAFFGWLEGTNAALDALEDEEDVDEADEDDDDDEEFTGDPSDDDDGFGNDPGGEWTGP